MRPHKIILLPLLLAVGYSQQVEEPTDGIVTFSSTSQLVVRIVTVTDKDGEPIEGLSAEDFTVTENGVPQTVSFLEYQKLSEVAEPQPQFAIRLEDGLDIPGITQQAPSVTQTQIAPEAPGDVRYRDRRLLALYFDLSSMPPADQLRAFEAAQKFLTTQMTPSDLVAVMQYSNSSVKVLQDFTGDRNLLLATIDKMVVSSEGLDLRDDSGTSFGQNVGEFNIFNTDRQLSALQTATKMLGALNEKKALIYFASNLRLNGVDNQAQLRSTVNSAIRANVSFFPIDARGLVASAPLGDATRPATNGAAMYTGQAAIAMARTFQNSQDTLYALASDTGGKALLDYNDLSQGIVQAQEAFTSHYILGYYSTNTNPDGKFRRVNISLKELPTAKLDFRQGYYGPKDFSKYSTADKERQLEEALMLGDPITDLTIAMEVNYFQLNSAEYYVPVMMKIPGSELELAQKGGADRTVIDFIGEIRDSYGTTIQNIRDKVDVKLSGETIAQLATQPIQYETGYTLLPDTYSIKVLARNTETGRIGTFISQFIVPNLAREEKRVPISSVVLSSQRVDMTDALYNAGKDKAQIVNPMVQDGQKLIPSVTRVFSKAREMYVYFQAYEPNVETAEPLVSFVTFYRGQAKALETEPLSVSEITASRLKTLPFKLIVPLEQLPTGRYTLQVTVLNPKSNKASFWQAPVMLVP